MSKKLRDLLTRSGWTALEAALAVVVASEAGWVQLTTWRIAGIVGVAAGLSAIKTGLVQFHTKRVQSP